MRKKDGIVTLGVLPFSQATIVRYVKDCDSSGKQRKSDFYPGYRGKLFLIIKVHDYLDRYVISGHSDLDTGGWGSAWHHHNCFELVEPPSLKSWGMILGIREDDEDEDGDDIEDDNADDYDDDDEDTED